MKALRKLVEALYSEGPSGALVVPGDADCRWRVAAALECNARAANEEVTSAAKRARIIVADAPTE